MPGQYVLLEEVAGDVPPRSYSIANAPRLDGAISLLVTRVPDGFAHLEATCPRFRFLRTLTREPGPGLNGRIPNILSTVCGDLAAHEVFIAGAAGFVRDCASAAEAAGAARTRVHTEAFFAEPPVRQMQSTTHRPVVRHARR